jgi:hypothetical protein
MDKLDKELQDMDKNCILARDIVRKHSVDFCNWILQIEDTELKKEKDPNKLFDKYLESL